MPPSYSMRLDLDTGNVNRPSPATGCLHPHEYCRHPTVVLSSVRLPPWRCQQLRARGSVERATSCRHDSQVWKADLDHPGQPPTLENRGAHPLLLSQSYSNDQTATVPLHPGHGQQALATDGGHDLVLLGARLGQRFERSPALRSACVYPTRTELGQRFERSPALSSACVSRHRDLNAGREGTAVEMHALHFRIAVFPILADVVAVKTGSWSTAHWPNDFIRLNGWLRNCFA